MQPVCNRRPNRRQSCCSEETLALLESALLEGLTEPGGEGGIRTPDRSVSPYNGLANRRLQPLGHLSANKQVGKERITRALCALRAPSRCALGISPDGSRSACAPAHAVKAAQLQPLGHLSGIYCGWNYCTSALEIWRIAGGKPAKGTTSPTESPADVPAVELAKLLWAERGAAAELVELLPAEPKRQFSRRVFVGRTRGGA